MPSEFLSSGFVAQAVLNCIRVGKFPTDTQADFFDRKPLIDLLRDASKPSDISALVQVIETSESSSAGLAASILRFHLKDPVVHGCFLRRWKTAGPYLKNRIMWRLLDDPDLPESWLATFREFVFSEWNVFQEFNRSFYGTPEESLPAILRALSSPSFAPETKKWAYLCSAVGTLGDRETAKALIQLGLLLTDPFCQSIADELLARFFAPGTAWEMLPKSRIVGELSGMEFAAEAVIDHLRAANIPSEKDADQLNRLPIVGALRRQVCENDLAWITKALDTAQGEWAGLLLSLLQRYCTEPRIHGFLKGMWEGANPFLRAHIMWRLLDAGALEEAWHDEIFRFVLSEWSVFQGVSLKFLGAPGTVVEQMLVRIGDQNYTETKKWVCLCRVADVASNPDAARALLHLGKSIGHPFAHHVAEVLLERFYSSSSGARASA